MVFGGLGAVAAAAVTLLLAAAAGFLAVRRQLRRAAARSDEVRRLARLAAQETELALRREAGEVSYYYGAVAMAGASEEAEVVKAAPEAKGKGVCVVCSTPTKKRCARCKAVNYCSFECQRKDFHMGHKYNCHPPTGSEKFDGGAVVQGGSSASPLVQKEPPLVSDTESDYSTPGSSLTSLLTAKPKEENRNISHYDENSVTTEVQRSDSGEIETHSVTDAKTHIKYQTSPKLMKKQSLQRIIFQYDRFVKLCYSDKNLHPFGLINCGNSCYANVVLQCLMFTPALGPYLLDGIHSKTCLKVNNCLTCDFENLLIRGNQGMSAQSPERILSHINDMATRFSTYKEEDAHEFLRYIIDTMQLESSNEAKENQLDQPSEDTTLMQLIFGGYLKSEIKCTRCRCYSEQYEQILDLAVEIDGDIDSLEEALLRYTSSEVLDGENKYHCASCNSYQQAQKKLSILEAPNVLTVALKRYQAGMFGKISKAVRYPKILNLAPYMNGIDDKSPIYRLYAVVVHLDDMNSAFSGHYICYVKDWMGEWYQINDSQVRSATIEEVLSNSAYMLLYARCSPRAPSSVRKGRAPERRPRRHRISSNQSDSSSDTWSLFSQSDGGTPSSNSTRSPTGAESDSSWDTAQELRTVEKRRTSERITQTPR